MIRIDKEFKSLIPPLTAEEFAQLEENCIKDGIRDPLVVWKVPCGDQILVDGHNRLAISEKHHLPYQVKEMRFDLREDVIIWIIQNQIGRRNLQPYARVEIVTERLKPLVAEKAKKQQVRKPVSQNSAKQTPIDTRKVIARAAGVSHDTVRKVEAIMKNGTPEIKEKARSGAISIEKAFQRTADIMRPLKKPDIAKEAEAEHQAFEERKAEQIVSMKDVAVDKENRRILALDLSTRITKASNAVQDITLMKGDLSKIVTELTVEEKRDIQTVIADTIRNLTRLSIQIGGTDGKKEV